MVDQVGHLGRVVGKDNHVEVAAVVVSDEVVGGVGLGHRAHPEILMLPESLVERKQHLQNMK